MEVSGDPRLGTVLAGYRLQALLGQDDLCAVYLADDLRLSRRVALRVLNPELPADERFRERLLRESALVGELRHPSILPVYEAGHADGHLFVAMGYAEGTDLARVLEGEGRLEPQRTLGIVEQVAGALDAARWGRGLVHGGVRPIVIVPAADAGSAERVLLGGFGLRRELPPGATLSEAARHLGPVDYLAPEQIEGKPISPRADVYALGCVLFECLTGQPPFTQAKPEAVLEAQLHEQPPSVRRYPGGLPVGMDGVIGKAAARWPEERYSTCAELAAAARAAFALGGEQPGWAGAVERPSSISFSARPGPVLPAATLRPSEPVGETHAAAAWFVRHLRRGGRASVAAVGLIVLLALAAGAVWLAGRGTGEASSAPAAPPAAEPPGEVAAGAEGATPEAPAESAGGGSFGRAISLGPGSLVRIDGMTGETLARVAIPFPFQLAADHRSIWALSAKEMQERMLLVRVDAATNAATDIFAVGVLPPGPLGLAVAAESAWFSDDDGNGYRFAAGASAGEPVALDGARADFYAPVAAAGSLWVTSPPLLLRVDPATGHVLRRIYGVALVAAAGREFLWALGYTGREIVHIDTRTKAKAPLGGLDFQWADLTVADGAVWASDPQDNAIVRLDPLTGREIERIRLGGQPGALAAGSGAVWVAFPRANRVTRYDIATGGTQKIAVGGTPNDLVFARGSVWVAVQALTRKEYVATAEAICQAANDRFQAALAELDLPEVVVEAEDLVAANEVELRFSERALAELRAILLPASGRRQLDQELSLREREIDVMRQIAAAGVAGDATRVESLAAKRVDLTHHRSPGGYLPEGCPVALGA
jgi:streptogramin lyase